jgi:hypothetical protein
MKNKINLLVPQGYLDLTPEQKKEICNGCGAKGGIPIPDTIYGLDIEEACNIHDFRYYVGGTQEDKEIADDEFYDNLIEIIDAIEFYDSFDDLRKVRAFEYVTAVRLWGDKAFVASVNTKAKEITA